MRAAEILRKLADLIDVIEQPNKESVDGGSDLTPVPNGTFLSPLQSEFELLKKTAGVDNVYDENVGRVAEDSEVSNYKTTPMSPEESEALARMKKAAGVNALITTELSDDKPLDS